MENAGFCYSCRHISSTVTHCYGTGHLEPTDERYARWPGFTCVCPCTRPEAAPPREA